jgi:hypothetical protein
MPFWVELRRSGSTRDRNVPDPSGGTFDAAGDFDRLLGREALSVLGSVDPHTDTAMVSSEMPALLRDIESALADAAAASPGTLASAGWALPLRHAGERGQRRPCVPGLRVRA